jgi:hypothetical protein
MWIIQEPKKVALWNERHFEEKNRECAACLKYSLLIVVEKIYIYIKCNMWRVAIRPSYIQDARFLKVKALRYYSEGSGIYPRSLGIFSGASDSSMRPGVDSASKNEYQDIPGGKDGRCVRVTTLPPSCAECLEIPTRTPKATRPVVGLLYLQSVIIKYVPLVWHLTFRDSYCMWWTFLFIYFCVWNLKLTQQALTFKNRASYI